MDDAYLVVEHLSPDVTMFHGLILTSSGHILYLQLCMQLCMQESSGKSVLFCAKKSTLDRCAHKITSFIKSLLYKRLYFEQWHKPD